MIFNSLEQYLKIFNYHNVCNLVGEIHLYVDSFRDYIIHMDKGKKLH